MKRLSLLVTAISLHALHAALWFMPNHDVYVQPTDTMEIVRA